MVRPSARLCELIWNLDGQITLCRRIFQGVARKTLENPGTR